jgi:hypothetical protein
MASKGRMGLADGKNSAVNVVSFAEVFQNGMISLRFCSWMTQIIPLNHSTSLDWIEFT